jgi:ABC-type molybdate transport system substrate-binding protein
MRKIGSRLAATLFCVATWVATPALAAQQSSAGVVTIYAAGSLRTFVGTLAKEPSLLSGSTIAPTFASAGLLKDRIKAGERPDLFLSADMASPRELATEGRTILPPIAFARNHMCLFANRTLGITPDNLATRLLAGKLKIRASAPIADPSGDYAVAIFDRLDKLHPGAGKLLRDQAQALRDSLKAQPHAPPAALSQSKRIDAMIAYCSAKAMLARQSADISVIPFPPALDPAPIFGMVVLTDRPDVLRLALFLVSDRGQAMLQDAGLIPLAKAP